MPALPQLDRCAICGEALLSPKILPCMHTYCDQCIALRDCGPESKRVTSCLLCGKDWPKAAEWPCDYAAANLAALHAATGAEGAAAPPPMCSLAEGHESVAATCFCQECGGYACAECEAMHRKMRAWAAHTRISLAQLSAAASAAHASDASAGTADGGSDGGGSGGAGTTPSAPAAPDWSVAAAFALPLLCVIHAGERCDFYCEHCCKPLCTKCAVCDHNTAPHKCVTIEAAAAQVRSKLPSAMASLEECSGALQAH